MSSQKISSGDIRKLLYERYADRRRYAYAEEVGNSTGMDQHRRLDMVVVDCFKSNGFAFEGIEIKVSKSDLRRELQDSSKHNIFYPNLDYYSLAAPSSVVDVDLIPKHWGLYFVDKADDGSLSMRTYRRPCSLHDAFIGSIDKGFIASLMRAMWHSRPSDSMIEAAKKEGYEKALKKAGVTDYEERIRNLEEENRALFDLRMKLGIWGGSSGIEQAIEDYEAYRELDMRNLCRVLERLADNENAIKKAIRMLKGSKRYKQTVEGKDKR